MPELPHNSLDPAALAVVDALRLLAKVGGQQITEAMLQTDIAAGAPTNPNGTINLVHYAAWLLKNVSQK